MTYWKHCAAIFAAFSVLALAGCSHSGDAAGSAPGPNANDKAAEAALQQNGAQAQAAQAQAAQQAAQRGAAARAAAAQATGPSGGSSQAQPPK